MRARGVKCAVLAVLLYAATSLGADGAIGVPGEKRMVADGASTVFDLGSDLLVEGTDSVFVDGVLLDRASYLVDYPTHRIIFWFRPREGSELRVTYRRVQLPKPVTVYRLHELAPDIGGTKSPAESGAVSLVERQVVRQDTTGGLDVSGSKTVGVTFGGAEGGIDQSTRVTVTGQVEGVTVEAELSDQSSPIAPGGTTRDIEELDKLVISLRGRNWRGSFGDVQLGLPAGSFGAVECRAVGATLSGELGAEKVEGGAEIYHKDTKTQSDGGPGQRAGGGMRAGVGMYAGYASPKGLFGRVELPGEDGLQGPYVLAPDGRQAQVVPASEEVFLDGARMTRGWDADYTIDYSTGELVFTNRRIITRQSRVEATFQYVTGDYSRAVIAGGASWQPPGVDLRVGVLREADDPAQNFTEDLTAEERAYLGTIGSDTGRAWLDGAIFAGPGKGDYVKVGDHFEYSGRDSGDWQVRFTLVGDGLGDYVYDDTLLAYRFAGAGLGDYVPRVRIALPGRDDVAYGKAGYSGAGFGLGVEGMFRQRRLNLFSGSGAAENSGAMNIDAGWQDSSYGVNWTHRVQGRGAELAGSRKSPDFTYHWGGTTEAERNSSDELSARARPYGTLVLAGDIGRLTTFDRKAVDRYHGGIGLGPARYDFTRVADVTRHDVALARRFGWLSPRAGWQSEAKADGLTRAISAGLELKPGQTWSTSAAWRGTEFSEPDTVSGIWTRTNRGQVYELAGGWTRGTVLRLGANTAFNQLRHARSAEDDWTRLLVSANGALTPRAGLRLQSDFSQSYRKVQVRDELFRYVGAGQGQFRRDSVTGGYLPDPEGDYERVTVATGRFADARDWALNGSGEVPLFGPASLNASFSRSQSVADSGVLTDFGRYDARFTVRAFEPAVSPTLGFVHDNSLDRTLSTTGKATSRDQLYGEVYTEAIPQLEARARFEAERRQRRLLSGLLDYGEIGWRAEATPVVGRNLRLEVELGYEQQLVELPVSYPELGRFSTAAVDVGLARTFSFGARTKARVSASATRRTASVAELPFEVGLDEPLGIAPSAELNLDYGFSEVLSASARYQFLDRPDRAADHVVGAQLKAYF